MGDDLWIVVPNWDKFQHYKDRTPPWIKLYLELENDPEWVALTDTARGLLVRIWIQYASSRGRLTTRSVRNLGWSKYHSVHLKALNHAGWIAFSASRPLALDKRREEKKVLSAVASKTESKPAPTTNDPPRMNAGAYKPFKDESEEPFDEEAWIAEVSARAHASPRRAPIQDPILTEPLEPDQRMVDLAKDWLDAGR